MFGVTLSGRTSDRQVRTELKMRYFLWTVLQLTYETTAAVRRCECLCELAREEVDIPIIWRWQQILWTMECTKSVLLNDKKGWGTFINTASFLRLFKTSSKC